MIVRQEARTDARVAARLVEGPKVHDTAHRQRLGDTGESVVGREPAPLRLAPRVSPSACYARVITPTRLLPAERDSGVVPSIEDSAHFVALDRQGGKGRLRQPDLVAGDDAHDGVVGTAGAEHGETAVQLLSVLLERCVRGAGAAALVPVGPGAGPRPRHVDAGGRGGVRSRG